MTAGPRQTARSPAGASPSSTTTVRTTWGSLAGSRGIELAAASLAAAWAGYFLFTGMPALTLQVWPATLTLHLVVAGGIAAYALWLVASRRLPGGTPLDAGVLALVGAYALATYTSINWRVSLEAALQLAIALVAFYALADLPLLGARSLRRAWMVLGLALAVYALWVVGNDYADYLRLARRVDGLDRSNIFPPTVPRVHGVSDHPNVLAMVLVLVVPFWALAAWRPEAWPDRALGVAGLFSGGWALFLTLSRGGWIGAGVALVLTIGGGVLTVAISEREAAGERVTWRTVLPAGFSPTALAAALGALALALFGTLAFLSNSSTRPGWLFRGSLSPREDAWRAGRAIFTDHLLTGAGPNTFGLLYPSYSKNAARFIVHTQHAHNGFLQLADDAGVAGLLALAALVAALGWMLWRTWRRADLQGRLAAVGCAAALGGFAAHNQLDAGNIWKATGVALAFVGAIAVRTWREGEAGGGGIDAPPATRAAQFPAASVLRARWAPWARYAGGGALALLLIVPLAAWWRIDRAHRSYWLGMQALNEGRDGAIARLQEAVNGDSSMAVYQLELGIAQVDAYARGGRSDGSLLSAGIIHLERAAALDPRADLPRANLARAYQLAGRDEDAARQAELTRLETYHVAPVLVAGEVYEDLGREADAVSTYGQAISMDAGLSTSSFWQLTEFRRTRFDAILKASVLGINPCVYGGYLVEASRPSAAPGAAPPISVQPGRLQKAADDCQFLIFTGGLGNDLATRTALAKIDIALGKLDDAEGHLRFAVDRQPDFGPARTELGRLYAARGDLDAARRQWLRGGELDQPESLLLLGDSYPAEAVPRDVRDRLGALLENTGSSTRYDAVSVLYFRMRYQRISPVAPLVPGDWQAAVPRLYAEMADAVRRWSE